MTKVNIRGKRKRCRREGILPPAQPQAGWLWNGGCFYSKVYGEIYWDPNVGKWNSSSCPEIIGTKVYVVWHPWLGATYKNFWNWRHNENWGMRSKRTRLAKNSYSAFALTSFMTLILNLFQSWKKIVKTNINKIYCLILLCLTWDILILRMIQFKRRSKTGFSNSDPSVDEHRDSIVSCPDPSFKTKVLSSPSC